MRTNDGSAGEGRGTVGGRARRDQIERAAAEVLADVGYGAASVALIARHAGVSKGVITYHFPSKDELLRRVALRLFQECAAHIAACTNGAATPADRLRAGISAELEFFSSRRIEFRAMAEVMANHRDAGFVHAFNDVSAAETEALADLLVEGQALGQFRAFDADEFSHLISSAKNGLLDRWAADDTLNLESASAAMIDFVESAVLAR
ncbi:TetR family transcriptional regulator [Dietzia sp. CQ4]|uniref:TetR/AcrR family transcriptional regulator n=1 Tax=Dietzia TaxID=37914 RepID=UPI0015F8DFCB|nr:MULTISPECIES: TetR/AcrR family transcriptional regulator [unclassified Dietzia]MBB1035543.1 TetR family transcriptional regulator [Dietzia sp. CQ4]MBB1040330.1 TetR family transcriptional regulator [Dietzia sp. Cai40]MBB1043259.1 TetR family transcriptional regulator [Dietzia sp. DQ11-44]